MARKMNTDLFLALRQADLSEEQAKVIATAIPDIERPIAELRSDMDHQFAELELKFVTAQRNQTRWLGGLIITVLLAVIASNFIP